ncbi:lipoprotein [Halovivax asiaticus JCM 14624]|uniref:Lipoprotein n=1 Tax=Halovivax asiaticus JCM 14624 TaxID=1227490 RepID=M0BTX0_9EURY|nr:nitrous oxide reductase accessory protein NosL [Halovivax asiaticus]ELZ13848.1 lipoprotein [Halovivax asiaticus JCM 14624]
MNARDGDRRGRDSRSIARSTTRRRVLAAAGVGGVSLVAGCVGGEEEPDGPDDPSDDGSDVPYTAAGNAIDDHPIDEPVKFIRSHKCPVCGMGPADYAGWACQLAHADGTGLFFESPGCLLAYVVVPRAHPTDAPIERIWFVDAVKIELFDAADGYLVAETELENQNGPMGGNPVPFATRERAAAYVEDADHLDEDAIITMDDVDFELADFYRGNRMPDAPTATGD